jgi:hypothetical protein
MNNLIDPSTEVSLELSTEKTTYSIFMLHCALLQSTAYIIIAHIITAQDLGFIYRS